MNSKSSKPRIGVFKFASCDGCQLSILDAEDDLLALAGAVDLAYFPEASRNMAKGPYDIALVEGSITTHHDADRIQHIRRQAKVLIAIGACATAGGIQALRNWQDVSEFVRLVYAKPDYISTLKMSTPIAEHVPIDLELRGCPINKEQLIEVVCATLAGRKPNLPAYSLCLECKRNANTCVLVALGTPCLGPVTQAGCGAICPSMGRGCYGCFGPMENANAPSLAERLAAAGTAQPDIERLFRTYNAWAWQFRKVSEEVHQQ
jgi:coenzyme F420-reducing hydrogenase gamma subunit